MTYTPHHPLEPVPARPFTPVPVRPRHDGWTPERQAAFIEALAACGCVGDAAARVGMSTASAYALRQREGATSFRTAWDAALSCAVRLLSEAAFSRALHGVAVPHFYKGEKVGEHRRFNESLTRFLLQHLDARTYAPDPGVRMHNLDEKRIAMMAAAVREVHAAGAATDVPASFGGDPGVTGEVFAEPATSATPDEPARDDLDSPIEDSEVPSDVSLTSQTYERWGDEHGLVRGPDPAETADQVRRFSASCAALAPTTPRSAYLSSTAAPKPLIPSACRGTQDRGAWVPRQELGMSGF